MPLQSQVHIDRPLSNFAVEYRNEKLIAPMVCPWVPVNNKSDLYITYTKKDRFTVPNTIRGPKAEANEVDWTASNDSYACVDHALREFLPDTLIANADPGVDPRRRTNNFVTDLLLLDYELFISKLTTTYSNYGANYRTQLSGGDRWEVYATSDPIGVVETGKAACFMEPNKMWMGIEVWRKLKHHPQILDRISGGSTNANPAMVTPTLVAELFEIDELIIGRAKYNTANKGQSESFSYVWGKDVVLAYVENQPSLDGLSAFKSFRWNQLTTNAGFQTRTYRDESKGGGGEWIEVETSYAEKRICSDVAYLIDTVIS